MPRLKRTDRTGSHWRGWARAAGRCVRRFQPWLGGAILGFSTWGFLAPERALAADELDERAQTPSDSWRVLGPDTRAAFLMGFVSGVQEAAWIEDPRSAPVQMPHVEPVISAMDSLYAEESARFIPWRVVASQALDRVGFAHPLVTPAGGHEEARTRGESLWLANHPRAARLARRKGNAPPAPLETRRVDPCRTFHGWLLEAMASAEGSPSSALALQLELGRVELEGGQARVVAREPRNFREHAFEDVEVVFDVGDSVTCAATVVLVDRAPTRVDGIPAAARRRFRKP